jgi:hypothetical protein
VGQHGIEGDGQTNGGQRAASGRVQLRRMASATATRMEEAALIFSFSRLAI